MYDLTLQPYGPVLSIRIPCCRCMYACSVYRYIAANVYKIRAPSLLRSPTLTNAFEFGSTRLYG